jgi:hypothetical protein
MMTVGNSPVATVFACAAFSITAANAQLGPPTDGRPVTAEDIVGKKICWNDGPWIHYLANGEISNFQNSKPHNKWSVPEPGVIKVGVQYSQVQILPNGQFYFHRSGGLSITGHIERWGTVCN